MLRRYIAFSLFLGLWTSLVGAQTGGTISLAPNFLPDPTTVDYIAGGILPASERFGENCQGFISEIPDHILNLQTDFAYLRLEVASAKDTMMVVVQSSSQRAWCNDDSAGNTNPRIAQQHWAAGEYQIFVGTHNRQEVADYRLSVSEYQLDFTDFNLSSENPYYIRLAPDFTPDPMVRDFAAGGARNATTLFGADCIGYISEQPDFVLEVLEPIPYLRLYTESEADTTLVLQARGEARAFCNDDSNGVNPQFIASFPTGIFDIYVGLQTPNQDASYRLFITEYAPESKE